jgi:acetylornithine aminotransferase
MITHGNRSTLTDSSGRDYLDFTAGIAVVALGHNDPEVNKVVNEQSGKIAHASNIYWNEHAGELAKSLVENTKTHKGLGLSEGSSDGAKVFFSNSGTEANEGAMKFARLYGKQVGGDDKTGIVCFTNAFHGRTMGALSCTPNPKYQAPFAPLIPGVRVGEYNNMDEAKMRELVDEHTCGVIVEPIQGEGGVGTASVEWLELLGKRCREVGAVLIYDEIQVRQLKRHDSIHPLTISVVCSELGKCGLIQAIPLSLSKPTSLAYSFCQADN